MGLKKVYVVLGLGFGDEGKGLTTDYLCLNAKRGIVIRYNGGHQAGHTVVNGNGDRHVFSNFGSGSFRKIPTYWSSFCTFSPIFFLEELDILPVEPIIYIDKQCPVTTHYDVLYNRAVESSRGKNRHGSCGVGFGATIDRSKTPSLKLTFEDLFNADVCISKMEAIKLYYKDKINTETVYDFELFDHYNEDIKFFDSIQKLKELIGSEKIILTEEREIFSKESLWETYIFEGAQGIMLDIDTGLKPYVTKSNTTSKQALEILKRQNTNFDIDIFYVTRAYLTRHGAGPFRDSEPRLKLKNNQFETNKYNDFQKEFKIGYLDVDIINHAIKEDEKFSKDLRKNIIITCLDQLIGNRIIFYKNNSKYKVFYKDIIKFINCKFDKIYYSFSSCAEDLNND